MLLAAPAAGILPSTPLAAQDPIDVESAPVPAAAPAGEGSASAPPPAGAQPSDLAWTETVSMEHLRHAALEQVRHYGGTEYRRPDFVGGYDSLPESAQRAAWRSWVFQASVGASPLGSQITAWDPQYHDVMDDDKEADNATPTSPPVAGKPDLSPHGLKGLWSIEAHGYPEQVLSASDAGATFLLTDSAIMRFESAGAAPAWLVKTEYSPSDALTTDANGDGTLDLVVELSSYYFYYDPTYGFVDGLILVVIDGKTGDLIYDNPTADNFLQSWTLSDVDGDGAQDFLGTQTYWDPSTFTYRANVVALKLDGTVLFKKAVTEYPSTSVPLPVASVGLYYDIFDQSTFADVNGDGVQDVVVASGFDASAYVLLVASESAAAPTVHAYDGRTGAELWKRVVAPGPSMYTFLFSVGAGDLTGDSKDDVVFELYQFYYFFPPVPLVYVFYFGEGTIALSGEDGAVVIEDVARSLGGPLPASPSIGESPYYAEDVADMTGDGIAEIIGGAFTPQGIAVVGRAPGTVKGGASQQTFSVALPMGVEDNEGEAFFANVDADPATELVFLMFELKEDADGNITGIETSRIVVDATAATKLTFPRLVGMYGIHEATKQSYGWTVENDHWVALDAKGAAIGDGTQLILELYAIDHRDVSGDGIPDLLIAKTIGFQWVDGSNGHLLGSISRPAERYLSDVVTENGRVRILEESIDGQHYYLLDLADLKELWSFGRADLTSSEDEYAYVSHLADYTADGLLEVVVYSYNFQDDEEFTRFLDPIAEKFVWEIDQADLSGVYLGDYLPARAGREVLMRANNDDKDVLELTHFGRNASLWKYTLVDDEDARESLSQLGSGLFVIRSRAEDIFTYRFMDAADGKFKSSYVEDTSSEVDADIELVFEGEGRVSGVMISEWRVPEDGGIEDSTIKATRWDWMAGKAVYSFPLAFEVPPEGSEEPTYGPYYSASTSDLNKDGRRELVFHELNRLVLRDGANGNVLAVGPDNTWIQDVVDLNGDGVDELGLANAYGKMRFVAYDSGATGSVGTNPGGPIQKSDPTAPNETFEPQDFFPEKKKGFIPGSSLFFSVGSVVLAAAAGEHYRRRRA